MAARISVKPALRLIMRSTGRGMVMLSFLPSITVTLVGAGVGEEEGDKEGDGVGDEEGEEEGVPEYSTI
jgi:hypothetical protein